MRSTTWVELLQERAAGQGERCAFTFRCGDETGERDISYEGLDEAARRLAARLAGVSRPGDRVLLLQPTGPDFVRSLFACFYAGLIAVPVQRPRHGERALDRLRSVVEDAGVRLALMDAAMCSRITRLLEGSPMPGGLECSTTDSLPDCRGREWQEPDVDGDSVALLQYTSGSTEKPRGVILTHRALLHNCETIGLATEAREDHVHVGWLPLYHDMGLIGNVLAPVYLGVRSVLMPAEEAIVRPERWLRIMSEFRGRSSGGPNFIYELCADKVSPQERATLDLSSWDLAYCGSEPVRADTLNRFADTFACCGFRREAFYPSYGLAEGTLLATGGGVRQPPVIRRFDETALRAGRVVPAASNIKETRTLLGCGHALNGGEVIVVDPERRVACPPDGVGEVWLKGGSVASGYWNQPEVTADVFGATLENSGEGHFLRTGDLGFFHDGDLFITGRLKAVMIIGGQNYCAEDIEWTVERAHTAICARGVAAFGIECDSGERPVVVVEVDRRLLPATEDACAGAAVEPLGALVRDIRKVVSERHGLLLESVQLVRRSTIPKTTSGKVRRGDSRAAYLAGTLQTIE